MPTALITGATAGLGAAFSRRLAVEQHDLILVARDAERLQQVAKELTAEHGVRVETLSADLGTEEGCGIAAARLSDEELPVDVLINNAGMGLSGGFVKSPVEDGVRVTQLNVLAVQKLAHAALNQMIARGRGDIINVSSVSGFTPGMRDSAYSASKAWVTAFSESLYMHTLGSGVRVMALCPGFVHTEFHQRARLNVTGVPNWMWSEAEDVVRDALHSLRRGKAVCVPGLQYKAIVTVARHAPRGLLRRVASKAGAP